MIKRLYVPSHTRSKCFVLLYLFLFSTLTGCQKALEADHEVQMKVWIDRLDRDSRRIGVKKSIHTLDSLVASLGKQSVKDRIRYYKFMKVLSDRDSTMAQNSLMYTDSLLQLFSVVDRREKNATDYAKILLLKGDDLFKQKEYYQAYRNYYKGKSILIGLNEICECARYSSRIANISFKEENYAQAIDYWKQEFNELSECSAKDNFELAFIEKQGSLSNVGLAYLARNEPVKALEYFKKAQDFNYRYASQYPREKNFIKFSRILVLRNQAEAYAQKGDVQQAETLIRQCLQHDNEIDWSIEVEQDSRLILTKLYISTKKFTKAEEQLTILKSMQGVSNNPVVASTYQKLQANILYGQGKFAEAGALFMTSLEADRIHKLKINAENKSNVGQLLQQIQREHEMELDAEKDARQNLILKFTVLIAIALSIIVYLIWRNARKSMQNLQAVTELNKAISQSNIVLQDTVNALEQAEIENDNVLKIVAHDLRSPIAAMISASHLIFWEQIPSDEQLEIVNAIQQSGEKANSLIGQILQSGPDRNKISKSDAALEEIVQSCIDMLSHKANEKQQTIEYFYDPATVPVDREKIWRVFCNLLSNAIKFSEPGGKIWVQLQRQTDHVIFTVRDNGIGISDEIRNQIFMPLNNARRSGTAGEQSFGIGLSICKQIIEAHGGRIWFVSENGVGTTFFIELPVW